MGYRSNVAILMYGDKDKCELVCNLFEPSLDEDLRKMFNTYKKVHQDEKGIYWVLWCINDVKWYDDCQSAQQELFRFVDEVYNNSEKKEGSFLIAAEFARTGEELDDNEHDGTDAHDWVLCIQREIDIPNFNWTKGE